MVGMDVSGEDWPVTKYDGCGKCLIGAVRLSRQSDSTDSPEKQRDFILELAAAFGFHIVGWTRDLEVSGATDPFTRPELGPWLRDELGPYDGVAGSAVDRIGRDVYEGLNLAKYLHKTRRLLFTRGHDGPWDFDDQNDENMFMFQLLSAQMEHRAITKRNRESAVRARENGNPWGKNYYGYRYVRLVPKGRVDHIEIDPEAAGILREVAERILADESGTVTCATEAARLNRAGVLSPNDHRNVMYGRKPQGRSWTALTVKGLLTSEAALGYQLFEGRPVLDRDGRPRRIAEPLWDRATREALVTKTAPKRAGSRAPRGVQLLSGRVMCPVCRQPFYLTGRPLQYRCTGRVRGLPGSQHCRPAPGMTVAKLDALVTDYFLGEFGDKPLMRRVYDQGVSYASQIAEAEVNLRRLREDRTAGLYDDDVEWFRETYGRWSAEAKALRALPEREAGMRWEPTGETLGDQWAKAGGDVRRRREILATYGVSVLVWPRGHAPRVYVHHAKPHVITDILDMMERARHETPEDARMRREREELGWRLLGPRRMFELERQAGGMGNARYVELVKQALDAEGVGSEVRAVE